MTRNNRSLARTSPYGCVRDAWRGPSAWSIEIVKRADHATGLVVLPRRWVVERTFGWLGRNANRRR